MSKLTTAVPATEAECIALNESGVLCELIDGRIVRKVVGRRQSFLAICLGAELSIYLRSNDTGHLCGSDLLIRFAPGLLLEPDLTFTAWDRCPSNVVPDEPVADIMPNLAVEVLSPSNRAGEMNRKLAAYFAAGVELVWFIDPPERVVTVFTSPGQSTALSVDETLTGGAVLPGFSLPLARLFARLG